MGAFDLMAHGFEKQGVHGAFETDMQFIDFAFEERIHDDIVELRLLKDASGYPSAGETIE